MSDDDRLVHDLLTALQERSVSVRVQDGNLRLDGPVAALPREILDLLRTRKPAVLAMLSRVRSRIERLGEPVRPPLGPLSPAQRAALAAEPDPGAARAVLAQSVHCAGGVETEKLRAAFGELLLRHDVLRAVVVPDGDGRGHRLSAADPERLPASDISARRAGTVDLRTGPAFSLHVHAEGDGTRIELAAHPLLADERTLSLALDELARLYNGVAESAEPIAYAEFVEAQARYLAHPATAARRRRAAADLAAADPAVFRTPVHQAERHTAPEPTADVSPIAAELDSTVSILRLGAFLLALRRRGRHAPRVAVEQPNRAAGPFAGVLGPVATTALLPVPAAATVRGFLAAVRDLVLDAHEHQDLPGDVPSGLVPRVRFTERRGPVPGPGFGADPGTLLPAETRLPCGDLAFRHVDEVGLVIDHDPAAEHAAAAAEVAGVYRFLLDRLDRCLDMAPDELPASPEEARRAEQAWAREASAVDAMREIFADVLDLAEVGPRDNFFELGGTSLSVARVVSRVGRRFGTAPSFADVLDHPCPAALAEVVRRAAAPPRPVLEPRPPLAELPASPQQVRYFLTYDIGPASSGRITVLTDEWDDAEAFLSALTDVVARHELLRTGFFTGRSGDLWQRVLPAATPEVTEVRLGAGGPAERRAELDALMRSHVFDLAAPPLLRVMFERRTDGGALAAVGVFSGILDAYSQGVLARELRTAYDRARDAARGRAYDAARDVARRGAPPAPPMPAPSLQYQDFCRWQHDLASGEEFARARDFWEERYPADHRGFHLPAAGGERAGAMRVFLLGEELSDRARDAAARCESSLFGFLLANFFERAAELYGRDDVSVGVLYHGRENEELAELIGYFVDLFCLRCDVRRPGHFPDLVRRVNQEFFRAVDARAYQYQHLAERLGASPSDPVFPVTGFHVNNVIIPGRREPVADDFRERVLDLPYRPKFDFNVYVHETDRGVLVRMAYATAVVDHAGAAAFAAAFTAGVRRNAAAVLEHAV